MPTVICENSHSRLTPQPREQLDYLGVVGAVAKAVADGVGVGLESVRAHTWSESVANVWRSPWNLTRNCVFLPVFSLRNVMAFDADAWFSTHMVIQMVIPPLEPEKPTHDLVGSRLRWRWTPQPSA